MNNIQIDCRGGSVIIYNYSKMHWRVDDIATADS